MSSTPVSHHLDFPPLPKHCRPFTLHSWLNRAGSTRCLGSQQYSEVVALSGSRTPEELAEPGSLGLGPWPPASPFAPLSIHGSKLTARAAVQPCS